jgi:hypothetical protein
LEKYSERKREPVMRLNEIGDRVIQPKVRSHGGNMRSYEYTIDIGQDEYLVVISNDMVDEDFDYSDYEMKIDFAIDDGHNMFVPELSGRNMPFEVLGHIAGVIERYLLKDLPHMLTGVAGKYLSDRTIRFTQIFIGAKEEYEGDSRRLNMYQKYAVNLLAQLGMKVQKSWNGSTTYDGYPVQYVRMKIDPYEIQPKKDDTRTGGKKLTFEQVITNHEIQIGSMFLPVGQSIYITEATAEADRAYRKEAEAIIDDIKSILSKNYDKILKGDTLNGTLVKNKVGGYTFMYPKWNRNYPDLVFQFNPRDEMVKGGTGHADNYTVIVINALLGEYDLKYIDSRLNRDIVLHEIIHLP